MSKYCYKIITKEPINNIVPQLKTFISKLYKKPKFGELKFDKEEELKFVFVVDEEKKSICIQLTTASKKYINRIEQIHDKLMPNDLKVSENTKLEKPYIFQTEQCAWWDTECQLLTGEKWKTLEHKGPYFTHIMEPYEPHGAPLIYDGKTYKLTPEEERIASFYAKRIISEKSGNIALIWTKDKVFNNNFWNDFKQYLTPEHRKIFKDFSKVKFTKIVEKLEELKEKEKNIDKSKMIQKKEKAAQKKQLYGYAKINNVLEPVGNFMIEPASIFYGRGENPKRGKIKRDIEPEEVTINIGEGSNIPKAPPGHKWKAVVHDHNAAWIAKWKDPISGEDKYVYFAAEGQLKGKSDLIKYEKARKLNKYIDVVRNRYKKDIKSDNNKLKQLGTVLYLIDNYGLRVGNEKDESETDTVGASTLRVEHIKLKEPNIVIFDFLGKDSIRYYKEIPVDDIVFKNFKDFIKGKPKDKALFDLINAADINSYLKTFDKDFSAKVFRTRLASRIMTDALQKLKVKKTFSPEEKKALFLKANVEVANVLNHRKTIPKKSQETVEKAKLELKELQNKLKEDKKQGKSTTKLEERIRKKELQIEGKQSTLDIAASTSLTNYIDPRIVVSWTSVFDLDISKIYTKTLQKKFKWALDTTVNKWNYDTTELIPEMKDLKPQTEKAIKEKPMQTVEKKAKQNVQVPSENVEMQVLYSNNGIQIVTYKKSIALIGDTRHLRDKLKGEGNWNPHLLINNKKTGGWIFRPNKLENIVDILKSVEPVESVDEEEEGIKEKAVKKKTALDIIYEKEGIQVIEYNNNYLIVWGNLVNLDQDFIKLDGQFLSKVLTINNTKHDGWMFKKQQTANLLNLLKNKETPQIYEKLDVAIIDYSDKAVAVIGNTKPIMDKLKELGGRYNRFLKINGETKPGWIFSKTKKQLIIEAIGLKTKLLDNFNLTEKESKILSCFAKSANVIRYLTEMILTEETIDEYLPTFMKCVDPNYVLTDIESTKNKLILLLQPNTIVMYVFLVYFLLNSNGINREKHLEKLISILENTSELEKCV
jgi:DNA topoisomerase I